MAKELITVPLVMSLLLGVTMELIEVAESSSEKVIDYANEMDSAIDCAFQGVDIGYCAPRLADGSMKEDFKDDLERTKELIDQLKELNQSLDNINQSPA